MSNSLDVVEPGKFIPPSSAHLRSVPDIFPESALRGVWHKVGPCLGSPKYDGWRFQIHKLGELVRLFSRNGKDWAKEFPSIVQMIRSQVEDDLVILDTELVGFDQYDQHIEPSKLRTAPQYRCYLLDVLYLNKRNLTTLTAWERETLGRKYLQDAFRGFFSYAEYTFIPSEEDLIKFYLECRKRRAEGFDGAIIKRPDAPYEAYIWKLKPEDTIDAVVVGGYQDNKGVVNSLLLAVQSHKYKRWVPIAKVKRTSPEWDTVWEACQPFTRQYRPDNLDNPPGIPDIWITPEVVTAVTMTELHPGKDYLVRAEYARNCILREDKGPEDATSFEQLLRIAGLPENLKTLSEKSQRQQPSLFEEYDSSIYEDTLDKDTEAEEAIPFEQLPPNENLIQQAHLLNKNPIQLRFSLFE